MKKLNPDKLNVEFRPGVTMTEPIIGRKYTLTHSDITADLFLTIGLQFAYEKINVMRDEVLAEWRMNNGFPYLYVYVYVDGEFGPAVTAVRDAIFRRELPLALEAIRYGDRTFFAAHSELDNAPIWIHFDSTNPLYNKFENWGTPGDYQ
ncbi:staygreen family protein [Jeotgalibacillus haloalkalitolerans]|uniref:Staygreen family protein n=1 Tax=Jeotgalibacillus haloalkalitolerans TaxID=3104292 RepID=A0ABU5KR92_9BACL|nr:staygreen family protein [Jeotgalibacillus sp. HH7-29]MDZ5713471.1 staygreen family protein [Jeotgalibacillus sp. HH7-29]